MNSREDGMYESFVAANDLLDRGQKKKAYIILLKLADSGYKYAFNTIGVLIENGIDPRVSKEDSLLWYQRAARRGDVCGFSNLGTAYLASGKTALAKKWFRKAMENGDHDAGFELAKILLKRPNPTNTKLAKIILKRAVKSSTLTLERKKAADDMLQAHISRRTRK